MLVLSPKLYALGGSVRMQDDTQRIMCLPEGTDEERRHSVVQDIHKYDGPQRFLDHTNPEVLKSERDGT